MYSREKRQLSILPRLRLLALLSLASLSLCLAALWLMEKAPGLRLPWMRIEEVEVQSEWPLDAGTVRGYLPPLEGTSLVRLAPGELLRRLLGKPWVRSVTIKKEYPNRLFIDVTAKRPVAVTMLRGEAQFVDNEGNAIDGVRPGILRMLDLPVVTTESASAHWEPAAGVRLLERLRRELEPEYRVSEVVLAAPPTFRVFLSPLRTEAIFSVDTFDAQLPRLRRLLDSPSFPKWQPHRINLVFPKKAIVSAIHSK